MAVPVAGGIDYSSLLMLLADGRLHSGAELAKQLGVSRAAIWKCIDRLRQRGVEVNAVPRRGYSLPAAVELLDEARIRAALPASSAARLRKFELLFDVDSTNGRLLSAGPPPYGWGDVVLCELQHAGRGRRGRLWVAPFGASLALSLGWAFDGAARTSPTLSLCVGVAVVRALTRAGARGIGLKWPNDLWLDDCKVGGVLLELRAEASGPAYVVIGVGLNVSLAAAAREEIETMGGSRADYRVAAVADACAEPPSRNFIAGAIIHELLSMLADFERSGFAAFVDAWTALDVLRDRPSRIATDATTVSGIARGVTLEGNLRLERDGQMLEFVSGEVSLRPAGDDI